VFLSPGCPDGVAVGQEEEEGAARRSCSPASEPELFTLAEQEGSEDWWAIGPGPDRQSGHCLGMYLDHKFGKC